VSTNAGIINFIDKAEDILGKIDNNVEREIYIKKIARQFDVSEQSIYSDMAKRYQAKEKKQIKQIKAIKSKKNDLLSSEGYQDRLLETELMILATICLENNAYLQLKEEIKPEVFTTPGIKEAAEYAIDRINSKIGINTAEIMNKMPEALNNKFVSIVQSRISFEDNKKAILDMLKGIKLIRLEARKNEINEIKNRSDLNEGDVELLNQELLKITANIIALKRK
jgi:DNA primase